MSQLKQCKDCSVELVVGENWFASDAKSRSYKCKECRSTQVKKWQQENPSKVQYWSKNWIEKNPGKQLVSTKQDREQEGKGVYLVKYRWINFYVGEGWFKQRRRRHLQYKFSKNNPSAVGELVEQRNLPRKYLSFHVLEYLDDKPTMLERETHYRRELKPYINPLD